MKTFIKLKCGRVEYKRVNRMNRTSVVKQSIQQNIIESVLLRQRQEISFQQSSQNLNCSIKTI